jgi:hypothetical protein
MTSDMAEPAGGTHGHREKITAADEGSQVQYVQFGDELDLATANGGSDGVKAATEVPPSSGQSPPLCGPQQRLDAPDVEQSQWLIDINPRQEAGGHVHVITADRPSRPVGPVPGQPPPGEESAEPAQQLGPGIKAVLGSLTQHVAKLESDNDRLRRDNDRLRAQVKRLRGQMQAISGQMQAISSQVARQVGELLASTGD